MSRYSLEESNNLIQMLISKDDQTIYLALGIIYSGHKLFHESKYKDLYLALVKIKADYDARYDRRKRDISPETKNRAASIINRYGFGNYMLKNKYGSK